MSNSRTARIAAQLQRSLAAMLQRGVKDPRVGNVTVTGVQVLADLSVAHVQVLPFGTFGTAPGGAQDAKVEAMLAGLRSAAGFLRGQVARELQLRQAPRLEFELDTQLIRAHELTELIDRTVNGPVAPADGLHSGGDEEKDGHR